MFFAAHANTTPAVKRRLLIAIKKQGATALACGDILRPARADRDSAILRCSPAKECGGENAALRPLTSATAPSSLGGRLGMNIVF
jgi:hypothetical protein